MIRFLCVAGFLGLFALSPVAADDKGDKKRDPEEIFKKADADSDGKVSKDEFAKFAEVMKEKIAKAKPDSKGLDADKVFEKLDGDKDGSLTLEEFKKLMEMLGQGRDKVKKPDNN